MSGIRVQSLVSQIGEIPLISEIMLLEDSQFGELVLIQDSQLKNLSASRERERHIIETLISPMM